MKENIIYKNRYHVIIVLSVVGLFLAFFFDPIPQNPQYHQFADSRTFFSIAHFWNVISNVPIILGGLFGLVYIMKKKAGHNSILFRDGFILFFIGITLSGMGSTYYHLNPNNDTLLWDRLALTIAFMAFFTIIIAEFVNLQFAQKVLYPFLLMGIGSVIYWIISENMGRGDLRFYILVQFLPLILIAMILIIFKSKSHITVAVWLILLTYLIAKIFEIMDYQIFSMGNIISGHTLKHLIASLAPVILILTLKKKVTN